MSSSGKRDPSMYAAAGDAERADEDEDGASSVEEDERWTRFRLTCEKIGENYMFSFVVMIATIWALYQTDIRLSKTDENADTAFEAIISIVFFLFLFEIAIQSIYKADYWSWPAWAAEDGETSTETWFRRTQIGSFYFWLDWIAALSLIFEVSMSLHDG